MISVLLADDQTMIRSALAALLTLETDIEVCGQAGTCAEAVAVARESQPDVVLLDVQMPAGGIDAEDGIAALPALHLGAPGAKVIVVTTFGRPGYLRRALEAGAIGFMVKDAPAERLIDGIRRAAAGLRVVDPELAVASLSMGPTPLSDKESEVLAAATGGRSTSDIAKALHLSEGTVRNYLSSAIGKLGARNRAEAVRAATDNGWL
ncbi:MAG: response regulator transcription factor [Propionibacteriaceae bacterium]|nr:response regulator transcription factor [Micropruina sp.]HBX83010.1 DNA-binding response regulator [Propionibacteriaceae bacterium]